MSSWAKPGMKCVCIDASDRGASWVSGKDIVEGSIYTIAATHQDVMARGPHIVLVECPNMLFGDDVGWRIDRFRPLVTRTQEQDMEHFIPLLNTVQEPA